MTETIGMKAERLCPADDWPDAMRHACDAMHDAEDAVINYPSEENVARVKAARSAFGAHCLRLDRQRRKAAL